jgi:hypothetical protein
LASIKLEPGRNDDDVAIIIMMDIMSHRLNIEKKYHNGGLL